jgi:Ser/Thr protein kinase RdoA (MazF antagonist)
MSGGRYIERRIAALEEARRSPEATLLAGYSSHEEFTAEEAEAIYNEVMGSPLEDDPDHPWLKLPAQEVVRRYTQMLECETHEQLERFLRREGIACD